MARNIGHIDEKSGLLDASGYYENPTSELRDANRTFDLPRKGVTVIGSNGLTCMGEEFKRRPLSTRRPRALGIFVAILLFSWWSIFAIPSLLSFNQPENDGDVSEWSFDEITPSEKLEWHPCYRDIGTYKCARLTVAMDYHRPLNASSDNPKVHVALVLVPGIHTGPKPYSTSPLLINPGGPGGSGTFTALYLGKPLQAIVGVDQDIIGFDPRGIAATTPRADCFSFPIDDDHEEEDYVRGAFHRSLWAISGREIGIVNSSASALQKIDTRARAAARLCEQKDLLKGNDSIFRHLSTPSVARDMLSIVDAWDEWTESLGVEEDVVANTKDETTSDDSYDLDTKGKLVYWGFSYGTLLGATFASMFPDRVGRLVLDGVVDADHYVGPVWKGSLRDTNAVSDSFSKYCHQASGKCALWRKGDSVEDVENRLQEVMASVKANPITLIDPNSKMPLIITYEDLRALTFMILYSPTQGFEILAMVADLLYRGLYIILEHIFRAGLELQPFCGPPPPADSYPTDAQYAIMCSDKRYILNETIPNLETRYQELSNISSWADIWMTLMIGCDGWRISAIDPPMRWDDNPAKSPKPIKTSFPLLFIGNTADPVTPLHAAFKMAGKFKDAGLIEQKSEGHCSLAAVSRCTMKKVRAYFRDGKVPAVPVEGEKWERCEADEWPFHRFGDPDVRAAREGVEEEEFEMLNAAVDMQEAFYKEARFWGQDLKRGLNGLDLEVVERVYLNEARGRKDEI